MARAPILVVLLALATLAPISAQENVDSLAQEYEGCYRLHIGTWQIDTVAFPPAWMKTPPTIEATEGLFSPPEYIWLTMQRSASADSARQFVLRPAPGVRQDAFQTAYWQYRANDDSTVYLDWSVTFFFGIGVKLRPSGDSLVGTARYWSDVMHAIRNPDAAGKDTLVLAFHHQEAPASARRLSSCFPDDRESAVPPNTRLKQPGARGMGF